MNLLSKLFLTYGDLSRYLLNNVRIKKNVEFF